MSQGERKGGEDVGGLGQINSHFDPPSLRSSLIDDERKGRGGGSQTNLLRQNQDVKNGLWATGMQKWEFHIQHTVFSYFCYRETAIHNNINNKHQQQQQQQQ